MPSATPASKKRARLEDRALFALRTLGVLALAVLGAAPFVTCSRLELDRPGGSALAVVIVIDDSMSMKAKSGTSTRFAKAKKAAVELVESLREGDSVGVVAAGTPARMLVAPSDAHDVSRRALLALEASDRGTDLETALPLAGTLARSAHQPQKRLVLLSDLADGSDKALDAPEGVTTWTPAEELRGREPDCGVVRAEGRGRDVRARVVCGRAEDAAGRRLEVRGPAGALGFVALQKERSQDVEVVLSDSAPGTQLFAKLTGGDALADDDEAPVTTQAGTLSVAVVLSGASQGSDRRVSIVEEAIGALDETIAVRPLFTVPESPEALVPHALVILDDPSGLVPEARAALRAYAERGGVAVALLGSHAGSAILGNTFEPFVSGAVRWASTAPRGADAASVGGLGATAIGLTDLAPKGRVLIEDRATANATVLARWADDRPLVFTRREGRGELYTATLGSSLDESDFALRPAFLEILGRALADARSRKGSLRASVGTRWVVPSGARVNGPGGAVTVGEQGELSPQRAGLYAVSSGGEVEGRVAEIDEREVDLTPRTPPPRAADQAGGANISRVELSPYVAYVLLFLLAGEAILRRLLRDRSTAEGAAAR